MGYIVQSIVFDKDKGWDMKSAREWVKNHKEFSKPIKEEETINTIRVRLFPPKKAEQMGFRDYRMKTLASGDVGIMLDIAYNKTKGGSLNAEDLEGFLKKSYNSKNPSDYKDFQVDKELSGQRVQVYHNPTTQQTVVAHRGTASVPNWIENVAYAVGVKDGKAFQHSKKVQDQAYAKYGKENITTIGHSKGSLHAEKYGQEGKEVITLNKPVNIQDALFTRVPKSQTDIRTQYDPVSFLRPFQRGNKEVVIKSTTKNPLKEHKTSVLSRLDPRRLFGSGMMCPCCGAECHCGMVRGGSNPDNKENEDPQLPADEHRRARAEQQMRRFNIIQNTLMNQPRLLNLTNLEVTRGRNYIRNTLRPLLSHPLLSEDDVQTTITFLQNLYDRQNQVEIIREYLPTLMTEVTDGTAGDAHIVGEVVRRMRERIQEDINMDIEDTINGIYQLLEENEEETEGGTRWLLPTISGQPPNANDIFDDGSRSRFYNSVVRWVLRSNPVLSHRYNFMQTAPLARYIVRRNFNGTIHEINMNVVRNIINGGNEDTIIEMLLDWAESVAIDINNAWNETHQLVPAHEIEEMNDTSGESVGDLEEGAGKKKRRGKKKGGSLTPAQEAKIKKKQKDMGFVPIDRAIPVANIPVRASTPVYTTVSTPVPPPVKRRKGKK
jgi:hypothetical protein